MASGRLAGTIGVALLGLLAVGCDSTHPSGPPASQPVVSIAAADCAARIKAVDLADAATVFAVDRCRFTPAGGEASRAALQAGATGDAVWAALWVYVDSASDPAPMRPYVATGTTSTRAMASAGLVAFGDATGFDGLRVALADTETLDGSTPPLAIQAFALDALERSVVLSNGPSDAAAWSSWLEARSAALRYDPSAGTWSLP